MPSARAYEWQSSGIWESGIAERAFDSGPSWFSAGPAWMMNAMPGANFRARQYVIDSAGDLEESTTQYNGYVGTLHDVFNVSLFNNVATFVGPGTSKASTTSLSAITATDEWTATATGTWSTNGNWLSGTAPPSGGGTTRVLQFDASGATTYTASNDLGPTTFNLNGYILNSSSSALITLANTSGNGLTFVANAGINPTITQSGSGAVTITQGFTVSAPLTIGGTGSGTLTQSTNNIGLGSNSLTINTDSFQTVLSGKITGAGGGSIVKSGTNTLVLNTSTNTFTGGVTLNAGNLTLSANSNSFTTGTFSSGSLGLGTLTLAGGKIQADSTGTRTVANKVTITGDVIFGSTSTQTGALVFDAISTYTTAPTNPFTLGGAGSSQRSLTINVPTTFVGAITQTNTGTGIIKLGTATLTFGNGTTDSSANTFSGLTEIQAGELDLNKTTGVTAVAGNLAIGDGTGTDTVKLLAANQIADTSDVTINAGGVFNLNNNAETIDALNSSVSTSSILLGSGTLTVGANNEGSFAYAGASSGTGGITKTGSGILILSGANAYTGDTTIAAGRILLNPTGSLATNSRIRLGDTIANSPTAGFTFGANGGGITLSNPMTVQASTTGTQGTRTLSGTAVNGNTNTYSGIITLNAGLLAQSTNSGSSLATPSTAGILLFQGGSIDFGTSALTVNSNVDGNNADTYSAQGTVKLNEALTSSNTTGGSIVKDGSGTLIIQSTGNSYTGSTGAGVALNTNGTRIGGGILAIFDDTSLGIAPATSANNVFFTTSALNQNVDSIQPTLRADANNITLAATRNINIASGVTGRIDSNGNTFTIAGNINGANGNLFKTGAGTLVLTGANTYTGATTINQGTLNAAANGALGSGVGVGATGTTSIQVNSGGTLMLSNSSATDRVRSDAPITLAGGTIGRSGPNVVSEGSGSTRTGGVPNGATSTIGLGALTLTSSSTIDFNLLGNGGVGTLTFASFSTTTSTLNVTNWVSSASFATQTSGVDGTDDRLIFGGLTAPNTAFITFDGTPSALIPLDTGFWEVVPIPETSTWVIGALALCAVGFTQRKRFAKRLRVVGV